MDAEIEAIKMNDTWELTELPPGGKTIRVKWVLKQNSMNMEKWTSKRLG